jgi:hypothetical protein
MAKVWTSQLYHFSSKMYCSCQQNKHTVHFFPPKQQNLLLPLAPLKVTFLKPPSKATMSILSHLYVKIWSQILQPDNTLQSCLGSLPSAKGLNILRKEISAPVCEAFTTKLWDFTPWAKKPLLLITLCLHKLHATEHCCVKEKKIMKSLSLESKVFQIT